MFYLVKVSPIARVTSIETETDSYNIYACCESNYLCVVIFQCVSSVKNNKICGFGLWCLTPLSTKFQLYRGDFIGGAN
jgi:hypothetical protein